jgi:hypothetical protein
LIQRLGTRVVKSAGQLLQALFFEVSPLMKAEIQK